MTTLLTDSGAGSDANPIGDPYTTLTGFNALRRLSNTLRGTSSGANNGAYVNSISDQADSWIQARIASSTPASVGLMLRCATGAANGYVFQIFGGAPQIARWDAGSYTSLVSDSGAFDLDDVLYFEMVGTTLTAKVNGSTVLTTTDSTYASGRFGLYSFADTSGLDQLTAGDFGSGGAKPAGYYYAGGAR